MGVMLALPQATAASETGCDYGEVLDCNGVCTPSTWLGDSYCDDGTYTWNGNSIDLSCEEHDFDSGDCEASPADSGGCAEGEVLDCNGVCAPESWLGDSYCDDGLYAYGSSYIDFFCEEWDYDSGDCSVSLCDESEVIDCNGNCAPASWLGDSYCDDGLYMYNDTYIDLQCPTFASDYGDCGVDVSETLLTHDETLQGGFGSADSDVIALKVYDTSELRAVTASTDGLCTVGTVLALYEVTAQETLSLVTNEVGDSAHCSTLEQTIDAGTYQLWVRGYGEQAVENYTLNVKTWIEVAGPTDTDGDGLSDAMEEQLGTDPEQFDTDLDGLTDFEEVYGLDGFFETGDETDPASADTDSDGVSDGDEMWVYGTDPVHPESGHEDAIEIISTTKDADVAVY